MTLNSSWSTQPEETNVVFLLHRLLILHREANSAACFIITFFPHKHDHSLTHTHHTDASRISCLTTMMVLAVWTPAAFFFFFLLSHSPKINDSYCSFSVSGIYRNRELLTVRNCCFVGVMLSLCEHLGRVACSLFPDNNNNSHCFLMSNSLHFSHTFVHGAVRGWGAGGDMYGI